MTEASPDLQHELDAFELIDTPDTAAPADHQDAETLTCV